MDIFGAEGTVGEFAGKKGHLAAVYTEPTAVAWPQRAGWWPKAPASNTGPVAELQKETEEAATPCGHPYPRKRER